MAAGIVQTMPGLPSSDDDPHTRVQRVARWRAWTEQARRRVGEDAELPNRVMELLRDRMGLSHPDPLRAAENARELLEAGLGDAGVTPRAAGAMRREGLGMSTTVERLVDEYVATWTQRGEEVLLTRQIGGETVCVGHRDAIRINMWVSGELDTRGEPETAEETESLLRRARRAYDTVPRPMLGEDQAEYMRRHERWSQEVDRQAVAEGVNVADLPELWRHIADLAKTETQDKVSSAGIVAAEAAGLAPPANLSDAAARAMYEAGRDPEVVQRIARRYLEIAHEHGGQPVVEWNIGGTTVLARRQPGELLIDLWLKGERREEQAQVNGGELPR